MKKKKPSEKIISNSRAHFDYSITRTLVAGISLTGAETKSLRFGHAILRGAYVQIKQDGAWLINMQVNPLKTNVAHLPEADRQRSRRLLLKSKEIEQLEADKKNGMQVMPLRVFTNGRFIKIELGVGKGKKLYDKRESIKKRDTQRIELRNAKR